MISCGNPTPNERTFPMFNGAGKKKRCGFRCPDCDGLCSLLYGHANEHECHRCGIRESDQGNLSCCGNDKRRKGNRDNVVFVDNVEAGAITNQNQDQEDLPERTSFDLDSC